MRLSRYSLKIHLTDDVYLFYNTFSGSLAQIDRELDDAIQRALANQKLEEDEEALIAELVEAYILRPDGADEDSEVRAWYEGFRRNLDELTLTVLTTNACNMACSYCYEGEALKGSHMPQSVEGPLLDWVRRRVDEMSPKRLSVRFFGGEPFINPKGLLRLASGFQQIAKTRSTPFSFAATTNGTHLPRDLIQELVSLGLESLRVTLDGDEQSHNEKRPLKSGENGFRMIWKNLEEISELVRLEIAVNAAPTDDPDVRSLLSKLSVSPFRASIESVNVKPLQFYNTELKAIDMRITPEVARQVASLRGTVVDHSFAPKTILDGTPCQIHRKANFVVDPKGDLYPCASAIGRKEAVIGSIFENGPNGHGSAFEYFKEYSPLSHPKCKTCSYFPICGGGCRLSSFLTDRDLQNNFHCPIAQFEESVPNEVRERFQAIARGEEEGEEVTE